MSKSKKLNQATLKGTGLQNAPQQNVNANSNSPENVERLSANIVLDCAKKGDLVGFLKCFEDPTSPYRDSVGSLISARNSEDGKSPLEWAAMLGNAGMVAELLKRGADVNGVSPKGYGALHLAAAWDKAECLKVLIASGANTQLQTVNGERAYEISKRYNNYESTNVLECAVAKESLKETIFTMKTDLSSPEKAKILTKDEKTTINTLINEILDWIEKTKDAETSDYTSQQQKFLTSMDPFLQKSSEAPPEKPSKK